jgi:predicted Zn-dependent peptidase
LHAQDFLFTYKAGIEAVTAEDVLEAARRHLHPSQQTVVLAADARRVESQLRGYDRHVIPLSLQ